MITPPDSNDVTGGHQAALSAGKNAVTITVTAEDGSTVKAYTVNINQGVTDPKGWKASDDFDTLVAAFNEFPSGLWSDGTTMWVADFSADRIFAYRMSNRSTQIGGEFDVLAGNTSPLGIWSDGTTMWIADGGADKLSAYRMSNKQHDDTKDFNTLSAAGNISPAGIWSDGTTMWVADLEDDKLYAYRMSDRERDPDRDFDTLADAGNNDPYGVWSDGATMWVADYSDDKIYAYRMSDRERDPDRDFDTPADAGNNDLSGIWSDGTTMWVADYSDDKIYSYNMPASADAGMSALTLAQGAGTPAEIAEFDRDTSGYTVNVPNDIEQVTVAGTKSHAQATGPVITPADAASGTDGHQVNLAVGDTAITFVVTAEDGSTNTYTVTVTRLRQVSTDATLSALTVSPKEINGFTSSRTSYEVGVASAVTEATVTATKNDSNATVVITPPDSNTVTDGHQVTLSDGRNTVTITVTAEDTTTVKAYTVNINRGVTDPKGWKASDDLDGLIAADNARPRGIWANDTTVWVLNSASPKKIFAYNRTTQGRDESKDITIDIANPDEIWSDGTTLWVASTTGSTAKLYAYTLATGARLETQDFDQLDGAGNLNLFGMWSDGATMWVADGADRHLYAYDRSTKVRQPEREISLAALDWVSLYLDPTGMWTDGVTIWVAAATDESPETISVRAVKFADGTRHASKDMPVATAGSTESTGLWSDGQTMLVADRTDRKVYSFNMPAASDDADLSALTVSPKNIDEFLKSRTSYEVGVASTVDEATIAATANDAGASVVITPPDSNDVTGGHQAALSAGKNAVTITVTAEDGSTVKAYTVNINQGVTDPKGWKASDDLDGLPQSFSASTQGIWSDGTTMWVVNSGHSDSVDAYRLSDGRRDSSKDFDSFTTHNSTPLNLWGNSTTMWISDGTSGDPVIYAYRRSNGMADVDNTFFRSTLSAAGNENPGGMWSHGNTMWVADLTDAKIYAYVLSSKERDGDKDFDTLRDAGNGLPRGIWSDGKTMWVADSADDKIYAYDLATKAHVENQDFDTLAAAGNSDPSGLWSDGATMWVSNSSPQKVYAYNMPLSRDATLSALTVSPNDINGFASNDRSYEVGVASTVTEATVAAMANDSGAEVEITPGDSNVGADGHQVALSAGKNTVTVTVTAADGATIKAYTVNINQGVTTDFGWKASDDLDGLFVFGETGVSDVWRNDSTILLLSGTEREIYAYNADGSRNSSKDVTVSGASSSFWTNGTTLWIVNSAADRLDGYDLSTKTRDTSKDFDTLTAAGNEDPRAIWSDGTTMWVSDTTDDRIYAYRMSNNNRDTSKEFGTLDPDNQFPSGLYTDGTTMWVADIADGKLYAYRMSDKQRHDNRDFDTLSAAGNTTPGGMWADETTMLVVELSGAKVYSYNMPRSDDATLSALTVTPTNITGFRSDKTSYRVALASTVEQVTVAATANHESAASTITPEDAEDTVDGHQVDLSAGANTVTIRVTAENTDTKDYTINIYRGDLTTEYAWRVDDDINTLAAADNIGAGGIWSDGTHVWIADEFYNKLFAYDAGTYARVDTQDFGTLQTAGNLTPAGIWSDGVTMWVADTDRHKLYAYKMSDKTRDETKDFNTLSAAGNNGPFGIWSDGDTMWVSDIDDDKLYAYRMSDRERDSDRDFDTPDGEGNDNPRGIWSDGDIMWVTDAFDGRVYAYRMSDQVREQSKEFNTLSMPGNERPNGMWSDETIMWVVEGSVGNAKVYSYNLPASANANLSAITLAQGSGAAEAIPEFDPGTTDHDFRVSYDTEQVTVAGTAGHSQATGPVITPADADPVSDGHQVNLPVGDTAITLVVTAEDGSTRTYTVTINRRPSTDATLSALTISPKDIIGFDADRTSYEVGVASTVAEATVTATPEHLGAEAVITPGDSNDEVVGHQATLSAGRNSVTAQVTAEDTTTVKTYTVNINRGVDTDYGWKASEDMEILGIVSNNRPADMWSNGETIWIVDADDDKIYAYRMSDKTRDSDKDFNTLSAAGNANPRGMWSDGITMWVSDNADDKIYAYRLSDQQRDEDKDFNSIISQNGGLLSLWSDGVTMWVADESDDRIYAYRMSDKQYDSGKDFTGLAPAGNSLPTGIWSDGVTMWVADFTDNKVYAYWMGSKNRNSSRDFNNLGSHGNEELWGIWSGGDTMWVVSQEADKVYSYNMPASNDADLSTTTLAQGSGTPAEIAEFDRYTSGYTVNVPNDIEQVTVAGTKSHAQATGPVISPADAETGIDGHQVGLAVGDTAITFVVTAEDGSTNTYTVTVTRLPQVSTDATLSALTVSPRNIIGFNANRTSYEVGVASSVSQATVTAAANHAAASLAYSGTDADLNTAGHQVDLSAGRNQVTVTVTAEGGTTQAYTLSINRGITDDYGWKAGDDLDGLIASDVFTPTGIASDGSRFWITTENDIPIFAFNYLGQPEAARNIAPASDNGNPTYLWADATTLFVVDEVDLEVYAYQLSDGARQNSREFPLVNTNSNPTGIWSNGVTAWIADSADHQLYAYNLAGRTPDADKNIDLDGDNTDPAGVTSNGATIWVADPTDQKVYAYALQGGVRVVTKEINTLVNAGNTAPSGMWASQDTIWINDAADSKTYTYNLPSARAPQQVAADATLSALTVSPKNIVRFDPDHASYEVGVASTVTEATVAATPNAANATAFITPTDSNTGTDGHQVALSAVRNPVTIRVTSQDGTIRTYRVSINRGVTANFGWKADDDLDGLPLLEIGNFYTGIAESDDIFWISAFNSRTLSAYQQDGSRLPDRDITLHSDNIYPSYLWTDGQTIWVSDPIGEKLYAYRLSDGNRLDSSDITLHNDNGFAVGIWSDGTTIWVATGIRRSSTPTPSTAGPARSPGSSTCIPETTNPRGYGPTGTPSGSATHLTISSTPTSWKTDRGGAGWTSTRPVEPGIRSLSASHPTGPPCGPWIAPTKRSTPTTCCSATTAPSAP